MDEENNGGLTPEQCEELTNEAFDTLKAKGYTIGVILAMDKNGSMLLRSIVDDPEMHPSYCQLVAGAGSTIHHAIAQLMGAAEEIGLKVDGIGGEPIGEAMEDAFSDIETEIANEPDQEKAS